MVGLLTFDRVTGIHLDIPVGSLGDDDPCSFLIGSKQDEHDVIYGYSRSGKYYLLENTSRVAISARSSGMKNERHYAQSLIVSNNPLSTNPKVTLVDLCFVGLREWVGHQPIVSKYRIDDGSGILQSYSLEYDAESIVEPIIYENDDIFVQANYTWRISGGRLPVFRHGLESDYHVSFSLKRDSLSLREMMETWVFPIRDFLTFCIGYRTEVTRIKFRTSDDIECELYTRILGSPLGEQGRELVNMPLPYGTVSNQLAEMAGKWISLSSYAEHASKTFVSLLGRWDMPINLEFFASAVVLEALSHDMTSDGDGRVLLVDESVLEEVNQSDLSDETKEAVLKELYRHRNSGDLERKLIEELGEYATYVVPNLETFMAEHRDARNGYAHLNPEKLRQSPQALDLLVHTKAVQLLSYGALCMRMGLSAQDVLAAIKESHFMESYVRQSREHYALS